MDGDCSHKIKWHLLLGRWSYDKPRQHIEKQRHHLADKGPYSQNYVFFRSHEWMWELAERWRTDAFRLWYWRRLLRVPWTARISNQSILKEISPEYSSEGLMPKLQNSGHLIWRADSLEKTLILGKIKGRRKWGQQRLRWHHWLSGHEFEQTLGDSEGQGSLVCCSLWGHKDLDRT